MGKLIFGGEILGGSRYAGMEFVWFLGAAAKRSKTLWASPAAAVLSHPNTPFPPLGGNLTRHVCAPPPCRPFLPAHPGGGLGLEVSFNFWLLWKLQS